MARGGFFSKALFLFAFVFSWTSFLVQAQDAAKKFSLSYFGVVTNVNDQNMLNITQDLFYAQLRGISYLEIRDLRDEEIKESYSQIQTDQDGQAFFSLVEGSLPLQCDLLFAARIYRPRSDEKWSCAFLAKNLQSGRIFSRSKEYDSYYKILTDAKVLINSLMSEASGILGGEAGAAKRGAAAPGEALDGGAESLAGSWGGEKSASKIILLRSGRGFIVFNNGATMNVSVSLKDGGSSVKIIQKDKFNASFYPDIDRQTVLNYADSAPPIEWNMTMSSDGSLVGKKKTLVQSGSAVEPASVDVVWTKK